MTMDNKMTAEQHLGFLLSAIRCGQEFDEHCEKSADALRQALTEPRVLEDNRATVLLAALDRAKMLSLEIVNGVLLTAAPAPADEIATLRTKYEQLREIIDDGSESMTHDDAVAEVSALRERVKVLESALETVRSVLGDANEDGTISDTLWASSCETLFDYIDAARLRGGSE